MTDALFLLWVWVIVPAIVVAVLAAVIIVAAWCLALVGSALDRWRGQWRILRRGKRG